MRDFLGLPRYPFTRAMLEDAPDNGGVYALFDEDELIFLGRATASLKDALVAHQGGVHGACTMKASKYTWEMTPRPASRETELLSAFHKRYGHEPRCLSPAH